MQAQSTDTSYFSQWEDSYSANVFPSFEALMRNFEGCCEHPFYSRLNVPVWVNFDTAEEIDAEESQLTLGLMLTRHGVTTQWIVYGATEDNLRELQARILRVWANRADMGFVRYPPLPDEPAS